MKKIVFYLGLAYCVFYFSNKISAQTFGVIGDYGKNNQGELDVSNLIKSWNPDFIITLGDNNYQDGNSTTIDQNIGKYFHEFIYPYKGNYGPGATLNRFFPSLGNHDVRTAKGKPYFDYFTLPGNERYYDFGWDNVHFFALNTDTAEVDGDTFSSIQGEWLKNALASSNSLWKIVYMHESPYSSDKRHGSQKRLQWPFREWGATVVMAGHSHLYERLHINDLTYFVNGLGGHSYYSFKEPIEGSLVRYNDNFGAMKVEASKDSIVFKFINRTDSLIDYYSIININSDVKQFDLKEKVHLHNYPNPFISLTTIEFTLHSSEFVTLKLYNLFGEEIATLLSENLPSGKHEVEWIAPNQARGIYFCCLFISGSLNVRKAIIVN
ncbi:MAG: metallophosphoesterase [Bacteroidota bacterium]|nr:metallophosphoesterase [Bacteroidota bacterium]